MTLKTQTKVVYWKIPLIKDHYRFSLKTSEIVENGTNHLAKI